MRTHGHPLPRFTACLAVLGLCLGLRAAHAQPRPGMTLTFQDDFKTFDGSPAVGGKWMTRFPHDGRKGRVLNDDTDYFYSDATVGYNPFSLDKDGLVITAERGHNPLNMSYVSGVITTWGSFHQLYGYFEMTAKVPAGTGMWPAFWLLPQDRSWPPELDVMEVMGRKPTELYVTSHAGEWNHPIDAELKVTTPDLSKAFHTYGVDWQADTLTWYLDGAKIWSQPTPAQMNKPMYMLVNLAVGGKWVGFPDAGTPFPAHFAVKQVRAFADRK